MVDTSPKHEYEMKLLSIQHKT